MSASDLTELQVVANEVYQHMLPSPQLQWPLLSQRCGCEVWVKHENHNPTGAFKVRGGLIYLQNLRQREPGVSGVVSATRGNHGQSLAFAAARHGLDLSLVVPEGNSADKNKAMQALGAELIVHGRDFDESATYTQFLAQERGLHRVPSFHEDLVKGVASYSLELLQSQPDLDRVYVPIGLGSGVCGMITARNALGLETEIVGVVSTEADCYARSFAAGHRVPTQSANTIADGLAVRTPNQEALDMMLGNLSRVVAVSDEEVLNTIQHYFTDTHNLVEGAAAAALAALLQERENNAGCKVGLICTGGNIDKHLYLRALGAN
ncbi:MAG: threonine dehydratase [Gammaproteobacteria bacterium]|nr:threonine dehydratase [Gammaproteobacteria bacterium]